MMGIIFKLRIALPQMCPAAFTAAVRILAVWLSSQGLPASPIPVRLKVMVTWRDVGINKSAMGL